MHAATLQAPTRVVPAVLADTVREHGPLLTIVAIYGLALIVVGQLFHASHMVSFFLYREAFLITIGAFAFGCMLGRVFHVIGWVRPKPLVRYLVWDFRHNLLRPDRLLGGGLVLLILAVFLSIFSSFKSMIPLVHPYSWDPVFAAADRSLHGGVDPWQLINALIGYPVVTGALNFTYGLWFLAMYGALVWQAFVLEDRRLRMQFLLAYVLLWSLLGSGAATLLASGGPCYFGRLTGLEDIYQPLADYLRAASEAYPVYAPMLQEHLWADYLDQSVRLASGISAMPSMHVGTAVLFIPLTWRMSRGLGIGAIIFAILIMIGSVHLGWHYAVDGYVSAAAVLPIWWLAGRIANRPGVMPSHRVPAAPAWLRYARAV